MYRPRAVHMAAVPDMLPRMSIASRITRAFRASRHRGLLKQVRMTTIGKRGQHETNPGAFGLDGAQQSLLLALRLLRRRSRRPAPRDDQPCGSDQCHRCRNERECNGSNVCQRPQLARRLQAKQAIRVSSHSQSVALHDYKQASNNTTLISSARLKNAPLLQMAKAGT